MEQPNKEELFKQWSEKLGLTEEIVKEDFGKSLETEKNLHPDSSPEDQDKRALQLLAITYKKQLRSPAVGFQGMIIAATDPINFTAKRIAEAKKIFIGDSEKAVQLGLTDAEGTALDNRAEWSPGRPNQNFGKPLDPESWGRTVIGVANQIGKEEAPTTFVLSMKGLMAKNTQLELFKPVKFRAINKSDKDATTLTLNSSTFTEFEVDEKLKLPEPKTILETYFKDNFVKLSELQDYHTINQNDFNRIAIVEGDVSIIDLNPTSVGSRRIVVEDEDNMDIDSSGLICWVPKAINIDFSEQSKVLVIGRTSQGKKRDAAGNTTDEPGDMMMNTYSIYALPDFKISPEVIPLTEETTPSDSENTDSEKTGNW